MLAKRNFASLSVSVELGYERKSMLDFSTVDGTPAVKFPQRSCYCNVIVRVFG